MPVRACPGCSHIWPSNITDDGDPSTGLAFSSMISPDRVADIVSVWSMFKQQRTLYTGRMVFQNVLVSAEMITNVCLS